MLSSRRDGGGAGGTLLFASGLLVGLLTNSLLDHRASRAVGKTVPLETRPKDARTKDRNDKMLASAYDMPSACMLKHANPAVCFRDLPVSGVTLTRSLPASGAASSDPGAGREAARCGARELGAMTSANWARARGGAATCDMETDAHVCASRRSQRTNRFKEFISSCAWQDANSQMLPVTVGDIMPDGFPMTGANPYDTDRYDMTKDSKQFPKADYSMQRCTASDGWGALRIGPFNTTGGYHWTEMITAITSPQLVWTPRMYEGKRVLPFRQYSVGSISNTGAILGHPPIHQVKRLNLQPSQGPDRRPLPPSHGEHSSSAIPYVHC